MVEDSKASPIRVFISGNSGNKEIVTHQTRILMILNSLGIETEVVDITAPAMDEARDFMRQHGKKKEGKRFVLPPQIFNGEKYCGDYEDFDIANEDDELEEFLGIPRKSPKFDPNAGTNSGEPGTKPDQPTGNGNSTDKSEALKEEAQTTSSSADDDRLHTGEPENNNNCQESRDKANGLKNAEFMDETDAITEVCSEFYNGIATEIADVSQEQIIDEFAENVVKTEKTASSVSKYHESKKMNKDHESIHVKKEDSFKDGKVGEEDPSLKRKKLHIEIDETRAGAGFQNIKNAGRFWKASQIMGTRKKAAAKPTPSHELINENAP